VSETRLPRPPSGGDDPPPDPVVLPIEDWIDLHAFAPRDVASVVAEYLAQCQRLGLREVRIVHGRGTGAQRRIVRALLARHPDVLAFADAPPEAGGWGATVVTLTDRGREAAPARDEQP
jgi:DNA-nicking Smr family endonuclease